MNRKRRVRIALTVVAITVALGGCSKIGKDKKGEDKGANGPSVTVTRPTTLGAYQELINQRASIIIANEQGINLTNEALDNFIANTVGQEPEPPTQSFDLNNNPAVIKQVIGDQGYRDSFIPPFVETLLKDKLSDDAENLSEEAINIAMIDYKDYLDSLGIQEEAREDYIKHILVAEEISMQIEGIYYDAYAKAAVEVLQELDPEYLETLDLD